MNRVILLFSLLLFAASVEADSLDRLVRKYKKVDGAVYAASIEELQKIGKIKITEKSGDKEIDKFDSFVEKMRRKGVRRVRLLQLDECRADTKKAFAREAADAVPSAYEGLLRLGDDEDAFSVYLQKCQGYLKILILMWGDDACGFIEVESDNETLNSLLNF